MEILNFLLETGFWMATIRMATPLIFGTLGELLCERAGVLNLGIEGIMAAGCMAGWTWVYMGGDLWTGVLFAAFIGGLFGLLHALFTVHLGLSQHVTGLGITMLAASLSSFVFRMLLPRATTPPKIVPFQPLDPPLLTDIPFVGQVLFHQSALTMAAFLAVGAVAYVLYRTPVGLAVRMAGENPMAVEAQGLSVFAIRTWAVVAGSALMAVGGAFLTMSAFDAYYIGMVNGRGWICIALVVFSSWKPGKALLGCILFAAFDAIQMRVQQQSGMTIPYQFYLMMPYAFSIIALIIMSRRAAYPKALLIPFRKGER
ncbi:MAG: ABC transporter permease [Pseudodesulfovibrio sp.]|uniref:Inner-membrane translocator n=1 Tax=Pseudodesulfovibrio aespoeensis (strain ATCC 700646 / DSM 10631 / Aspo-2) TaxID=643562 RepID=E6VVR3_PSEA9|nr:MULTISPECIES: ABC transporter permease [Pseudodesulfovibrio]MBU4191504.1 ABC transporter permease [Pseudomonadota bacterium]ADU61265.1 inner-membrane translocator [Pseudodesulfovibrio aespoeensis Aspo-2]MBU4243953.1 ABC transporter permease [Pseudomonadota bacterium]MBU4379117.1 ABC transporter permease [Pseudomonadota bacterium]MBU4476784.1 ABC transporter permease [Pseudomonadota bacterium]